MTRTRTPRAAVLLASLGVACALTSCISLIGEPFEGYVLQRDAGSVGADNDAGDARASDMPDAGFDAAIAPRSDAEVVDSATVSPDAGGSVPLDASAEDASRDSEHPDAGDAADAAHDAPIGLGREGGCDGTPFRTFEFDKDVEDWKVEPNAMVDASVGHVLVEGSPTLGALRFSIGFRQGNQGTKIFVGLRDYPTIRCMSARIQVAPHTFDDDLNKNPGSWTVAAISRGDCFAQRPFDNLTDLRQTGVWYEVAFDTKDFRLDGKSCEFGEVGTILIGIANAYGTATAKPAEVLIDRVALY